MAAAASRQAGSLFHVAAAQGEGTGLAPVASIVRLCVRRLRPYPAPENWPGRVPGEGIGVGETSGPTSFLQVTDSPRRPAPRTAGERRREAPWPTGRERRCRSRVGKWCGWAGRASTSR